MKTVIQLFALWLLCGLIGELLLHDTPHIDGVVAGAINLGKGISHFVETA